MTRFPAALFLILTSTAMRGSAQSTNQIDSNPAVFTVLAAINAAGYNADLDSTSNSLVRKRVRDALAGKQLDSLEDIKKFVALHHQRDANAELAQYISFALCIEGPPSFKFRIPDNEMPPDVAAMRGLENMLPKFYEEAGLAQLWRQAQPDYESAIAAFHAPLTQSLLEVSYYLRNPTSGFMGRRFEVFIDLLGPPNQVHTRNYKDDYFVVVTPSPQLPIEQIRYAYLHYLVDPLALKYYEQLEKKKGLADFARAAPALEDNYKDDYVLLTTTCLVKAIESRLTRSQAKREDMVNQALREGFIYTPAFAEGLVEFEKQPQAMRLYFPELVAHIDLQREDDRLAKTDFVKERAVRKIQAAPAPAAPALTGVAKTLQQAEDQYRARNLEQARQSYLQALQETSQKPLHAKAYYGLARVAALQKDPELAEKLFQKTLELAPDPETKGWAFLYLGRLAMAAGEKDDAVRKFRDVIAVEGASDQAKAEARKDLDRISNVSR